MRTVRARAAAAACRAQPARVHRFLRRPVLSPTLPLECEFSIRLDRVTVESVVRLTSWAPMVETHPGKFLLEKPWWRASTRSRRESTVACACGRECQHLRGLVRDAPGAAAPTPWAMSWMPPSTSRCMNRPGARSSPAASSSCIRRGWAMPWPSRPALVQALRRGTPLQDEQKKSLSLPCAVRSSRCTGSLRTRRWHAEDLQPLFAKLGEQQTEKPW